MSPADLLVPAVAAGAPNARVVLKLADGTDLDIKNAEHFCGLVVLTPDEPVTTDVVSDRLLSFDTILEEYEDLTPDQLRRVIKTTNFKIEDGIALLKKCVELEIYSAAELEDRISE